MRELRIYELVIYSIPHLIIYYGLAFLNEHTFVLWVLDLALDQLTLILQILSPRSHFLLLSLDLFQLSVSPSIDTYVPSYHLSLFGVEPINLISTALIMILGRNMFFSLASKHAIARRNLTYHLNDLAKSIISSSF